MRLLHKPQLAIDVADENRAGGVFPASPWHYFYRAVGAQITFEPGSDGRAARLILHQNSRDQIAVRIDDERRR
jgi:hypothetical protein